MIVDDSWMAFLQSLWNGFRMWIKIRMGLSKLIHKLGNIVQKQQQIMRMMEKPYQTFRILHVLSQTLFAILTLNPTSKKILRNWKEGREQNICIFWRIVHAFEWRKRRKKIRKTFYFISFAYRYLLDLEHYDFEHFMDIFRKFL